MKCRPIILYLYSRCLWGILPLLIVCCVLTTYGQNPGPPANELIGIKGRIHDTSTNKDCPLAVIALLQPDSTLLQFPRTRKDGSFSFRGIPPGQYRLLISHPAYSDTYRTLTVKDNVV